MEFQWIGMATGKVAHIIKPNSFVAQGGYADHQFTLCGRRISIHWFQSGLNPYGAKYQNDVPPCSKCLKEKVKIEKSERCKAVS